MQLQVLDCPATITWNWAPFGPLVERILGGFVVDDGGPVGGTPLGEFALVRRRRGGTPQFAAAVDGIVERIGPSPFDALDYLQWRVTSRLLDTASPLLLVHAGALVTPAGDVVVMPGRSGAGKSSLTVALARDGFGFLSDELAPLEPSTGRVHPFPRGVALKPGSHRLFPDLAPGSVAGHEPTVWHVSLDDYVRRGPHAPPRLVVSPRWVRGSRGTITPLSPAQVALCLGQHSTNLVQHADALPLLAKVARGARGYEITYDDLDTGVALVRDLSV